MAAKAATADPIVLTEYSGPVYIAARKMQRNGEVIKVGDVIPDADLWPRLESWIRAGYVKEA